MGGGLAWTDFFIFVGTFTAMGVFGYIGDKIWPME